MFYQWTFYLGSLYFKLFILNYGCALLKLIRSNATDKDHFYHYDSFYIFIVVSLPTNSLELDEAIYKQLK